MTTTSPRGTAKIYAFVPKSRLIVSAQRPGGQGSAERAAYQPPLCEFGGGWYHDAAIQEAERPRKS